MSDDLVRITVSDGKYTFVQRADGSCYALRYDEPWREKIFDGMALAMAHRIEELEERLKAATDDAKEAEAYAVELEANLAEQVEWVKSLADDLIAAEGREARLKEKLARALDFIQDLTGCEWPYDQDAKRILAELTGGKDE